MKIASKFLFVLIIILLAVGCGGSSDNKKTKITIQGQSQGTTESNRTSSNKASELVDLTNKGIGPVKDLDLPETIDPQMANHGKKLFDKMCTACHRPDKKFVGTAPKGILQRRTPEWVMNIILNPKEMFDKDPLAIQITENFYGSPMVDQKLSQEEARKILEYFRTL